MMITILAFYASGITILHLSIAVIAYDTRQHRFTCMAHRHSTRPYESHHLS